MSTLLVTSGSPHIYAADTTNRTMLRVVIALMPALACALYAFGIGALIVTAVATVGCVVAEFIIARYVMGRQAPFVSSSALLTGLLLGFNLPSNIPVWIVLIGSLVAIGIGKMAFGGLGCNIFNPALVGRVFLLLSFPQQMTTWPLPLVNRLRYTDAVTGATALSADAVTGATPHAQHVEPAINWLDELIGATGGSLGEVGAAALIIGGIYLIVTRTITWHIPVSILATAAIFSLCLGNNPALEILEGGLLLGAIFMATDYVTSPMSHRGMILYGVMIGAITIIIRQWGAYPEGVSFAILLMNGATPLINRYMKPKKTGERKP